MDENEKLMGFIGDLRKKTVKGIINDLSIVQKKVENFEPILPKGISKKQFEKRKKELQSHYPFLEITDHYINTSFVMPTMTAVVLGERNDRAERRANRKWWQFWIR